MTESRTRLLDRPVSQTWWVLLAIPLAVIAVGAVTVSALDADDPPSGQSTPGVYDTRTDAELVEVEARLKTGQTIPCLLAERSYGVGLSCDWSAK